MTIVKNKAIPYVYRLTDWHVSALHQYSREKGNRVKKRLFTAFGALLLATFAMSAVPDTASAQSLSNVTTLDSVLVVPNPHNASGRTYGTAANRAGIERITFRNLPAPCTIRIYTSAGNHITTLEHDGVTEYPFQGRSLGTMFAWNGRTADNQYVQSDVYIYIVESPDYGKTIGRFVIIR